MYNVNVRPFDLYCPPDNTCFESLQLHDTVTCPSALRTLSVADGVVGSVLLGSVLTVHCNQRRLQVAVRVYGSQRF
jgi:hypothetical protein